MYRLLVVIGMVGLAGCMTTHDDDPGPGRDACYVGGCSGQVCSDRDDIVTTCEWRDFYECYRSAHCERQRDGACGWTPTRELDACLAATR